MLTKVENSYNISMKSNKRGEKHGNDKRQNPWYCKRERESYTLVNRSSVLKLAKTVALCLLFKNINMNTKTEIKPIQWLFIAVFFAVQFLEKNFISCRKYSYKNKYKTKSRNDKQ